MDFLLNPPFLIWTPHLLIFQVLFCSYFRDPPPFLPFYLDPPVYWYLGYLSDSPPPSIIWNWRVTLSVEDNFWKNHRGGGGGGGQIDFHSYAFFLKFAAWGWNDVIPRKLFDVYLQLHRFLLPKKERILGA